MTAGSRRSRVASAIVTASIGLSLSGCAYFHYPVNPPSETDNQNGGYRYAAIAQNDTGNEEETFLIVTLSGGGTRAAALAYGVLQELEREKIPGSSRTLLDEADVISSVSGGSFAAAYYGLFGKEEFFRDFKEAVLYRKIERDLIVRILAPWNWPRLLSPYFGRADLADEYYDKSIFKGRTFADMPLRRPLIMLNATDITLGAQLSFVQDDFDKLHSNLSPVKVSRGVAASSAFPVAFTPLTVKNYAQPLSPAQWPGWVRDALKDFDNEPTRYERAAAWLSYSDANRRPYIHLSDGGLSDNIGLRAPLTALTATDSAWSLIGLANRGRTKRIVVIVVDAKPQDEPRLDRCARPPGIYSVLNAAATKPMENYSADSVKLLRDAADEEAKFAAQWNGLVAKCAALAKLLCATTANHERCVRKRRAQCEGAFDLSADLRPQFTKLYVIHVRFAALPDGRRQELEGISTALQLSHREVDGLIDAGAELLRTSPQFNCLVHDLRGDADSGTDCP